ncbi:MAG: hypothetical protein HKN47_23935 [Pirellulaceae bacterium]|nr:hypothetical protein [Pirellulaceae bacterium]
MLRKLDLTYTVTGESLEITTIEAIEQRLLNRIYWLEGTGFAPGDFQSIIDALQTSIVPDTWEALGGPSTMAPLKSLRPAIMISTTYSVHEEIERFFEAVRETHFGVDPVLETIQVPAKPGIGMGGMGGGLGGGGMF